MTGVILFRAQPLHNGHLNTIIKAYKDCKQTNSQLYIFVGSADKSGTKRNPIPIDYRLMLIKGVLHENFNSEDLKNIHTVPLEDMTDESDNSYSWGRYLFMKMLGHTKDMDMTIYYSDRPDIMLGWFDAEDRWCMRFKFLDRYDGISATLVRNLILQNMPVDKFVPNFVNMHIDEIREYIRKPNDVVGDNK